MAIVQSPIAIFWYSVLNVVAKRKRTGITQTVEGKTFKLHVSQTKNYWQTTFRSSPTGCWSNEWLLWCVVGRRHLVIVCRRSSFPLSCPAVVICSFRLVPRFQKQFLDLGATRKNPVAVVVCRRSSSPYHRLSSFVVPVVVSRRRHL